MYIARYACKYSLREIAQFFGNIAYSNVSYSIARIRKTLHKDRQLQKDIKKIIELVDSSSRVKIGQN